VRRRESRSHIAYALKQDGGKFSRWLEIGSGRVDSGTAHVFLDRLPIGGFNGYVCLAPIGIAPPNLKAAPRRPAPPGADDEDENQTYR
jgi:hypothetical protein